MAYRAIFLDMDHTLCDTGRADKLGLQDFQTALGADLEHEVAAMVGKRYLKIIYGEKRAVPGWQKLSIESEMDYRARLLGMTLETEFHIVMAEGKLLQFDSGSDYTGGYIPPVY